MAGSLRDELEVVSEDEITYLVRPFRASRDALWRLWECVQRHEVLTSDFTRGNFDYFMEYVLDPETVLFEVLEQDEKEETLDKVGVVYADHLIPGFRAEGHFIFWDYRLAGRQSLLLCVMAEFMDLFHLERLDVEVPINAYAALRRVQKMGFLIEGRRRKAVKVKGVWIDSLLFGVLREELTETAVEEGCIKRHPREESWFGLLGEGDNLAEYILKEDSRWEA